MKKLLVLFSCLLILNACGKEKEIPSNVLVGNWKLTSLYVDPGDGSGVYVDVNSNKQITFFNDGSFTSKGDICDIYPSDEGISSGSYSVSDTTIVVAICKGKEANIDIKLILEKDLITIYYPCIEGCANKYTRQ